MTFIQEAFFEVWIVLLCINIAIFVVASVIPGVPIVTPFTAGNVTAVPLPQTLNYSNPSGTIVGNLTTALKNETNGNPLDPIKDFVFFPLNVIWFFATFVTGGFALNVLGIFGFPSVFVISVQAIMLILMARGLLYYFTGR